MSALPRLLTVADLPAVELRALELDHDVRRVGRGWSARDVQTTPSDRLTALGLDRRSRLIADRAAAAWVWGAAEHPPDPVTCCVRAGARARPVAESGFTVREVVIAPREVALFDGGGVTSPLRTALDLARFSDAWSQADDRVLRRLAQIGGFTVAETMIPLAPARRLPGSRRARARFESALGMRATADGL